MIISNPSQQTFLNPLSNVRPDSSKSLGGTPLYVNTFSKGSTQNVRYFSGLDAELYFGDIYIDEAVQIDFSIQQNTMPLFGYNSFIFDDVARGSRLIQGKFVINFTRANFMYYVLNTLKKSSLNSGKQTVVAENDNTIEQYDESNNKTRLANTAQDPIVLHEKSPLWNCSFDIWVSYGDGKQSAAGSSILVLKDVVLTGCSQQMSISGDPIYEEYAFIARDVQFVPLAESAAATQKTTAPVDDSVIKINQATYSIKSSAAGDGAKYGILTIDYSTTVPIIDIGISSKAADNTALIRTGSGGDKISSGLTKGLIAYSKKYRVSDDWYKAIDSYLSGKSSFPLAVTFFYYPQGKTDESKMELQATAKLIY